MRSGNAVVDERIVRDAQGRPVIKGANVPVLEILERAADGLSITEILARESRLELADVKMAFAYAANLVQQQAGHEEAAPSATYDGGDGSPALDVNKILVVDDHELNRLYMETMFRRTEFAVSVASDGDEALDKARGELPFLILSDVQMPRMDGFELCRQLKADDRTKGAAVIFVTAHHRSSEKVSEGLDMGADDYIFRPFERRELLSRVRAVARLKRAEEEARRQAQTVARRNKELELLNELAVAVASSFDLKKIFAVCLQELSQLLEADAISLLLFDPEAQELAVHFSVRGAPPVTLTVDFRPEGRLTDQVVQDEFPPMMAGLLQDPANHLDIDVTPVPDAITCVPMISREATVGAISILGRGAQTYSPADWVLLKSAAGIVAIGVENARLLQNVQQQVADLALLNEIGKALTSTLDLEQILERTTLLVQQSIRADAVLLWLVDEADQELVLTACSGLRLGFAVGSRVPKERGLLGSVLEKGEPVVASDWSQDESQTDSGPERTDGAGGSMLCIPIQVKNQTIGVVQASHVKPSRFDQNDVRWLFAVASSVGIAIENARLFSQVQTFNRQLERKVSERTRELAEEKEKTEAILASMADGLLVLDAQNQVLTANAVAESMLDFRLGAVRGRPISVERLGDPLWQRINDMVNSEKFVSLSASVDVAHSAHAGGLLSIQALAARVRDESGAIIGTVIVLRDITAIKEMERIKARFMAGVTHELKTPLSIIRLHANNLQAYHQRLSAQKRDELLGSIQAQTELLGQLVEDILALSRLDAGEAKSDRQPVDLSQLIDEVVSDLRPLAQDNGVDLCWDAPDAEMIIVAERGQIKRMLRNLVDNGIKYTPRGGCVILSLAVQNENHVKIKVRDTGIGIPPEHQVLIFDRFYRVDPSHTIPGTGLGLSIVKEIVNLHGGDIMLESAPGQGTVFTVVLPGVQRTPKTGVD
jgi:PAS domain S-box-containing protein